MEVVEWPWDGLICRVLFSVSFPVSVRFHCLEQGKGSIPNIIESAFSKMFLAFARPKRSLAKFWGIIRRRFITNPSQPFHGSCFFPFCGMPLIRCGKESFLAHKIFFSDFAKNTA